MSFNMASEKDYKTEGALEKELFSSQLGRRGGREGKAFSGMLTFDLGFEEWIEVDQIVKD